ncbi:calcium/calmodulin-dependent 3',5'-cyclic nucleotide phosphodiesterase 1B-like, partial [Lagopus leucura]|uniref:calcium/calmodulin-dependent 3',5'-cyclic nucleotide phosphodiesterase 1B-like n=1 Tax=Lagopus leucura TaxID=30410 RepID=UPI001C684DC1
MWGLEVWGFGDAGCSSSALAPSTQRWVPPGPPSCPPTSSHPRPLSLPHSVQCWGSQRGSSCHPTPLRLRYMVKQLETGEVNVEELKRNLEYTASLLEAVYIDETRQMLDTEDELREMRSDAVPSEVRDWLAATFTQQARAKGRRAEEKPKFRSIVHAVQAGIFVERMFRRSYTAVGPSYSNSVLNCLKSLDLWCFDVFALHRVTEEHSLRTIVYELFTRHNLNSRFKIPAVFLTSLLDALEVGYGKYRNPYHNQAHAADVTQTVHCFLLRTGMLVWGQRGDNKGTGVPWAFLVQGCLLSQKQHCRATHLSPWKCCEDAGGRGHPHLRGQEGAPRAVTPTWLSHALCGVTHCRGDSCVLSHAAVGLHTCSGPCALLLPAPSLGGTGP